MLSHPSLSLSLSLGLSLCFPLSLSVITNLCLFLSLSLTHALSLCLLLYFECSLGYCRNTLVSSSLGHTDLERSSSYDTSMCVQSYIFSPCQVEKFVLVNECSSCWSTAGTGSQYLQCMVAACFCMLAVPSRRHDTSMAAASLIALQCLSTSGRL